ncbi:E3 ubiquitin ligase BIG BROTHER-related [Diplonema papillatum]|nr:E3 ubiquitin ligase BIG BROTHER-related [Diplonema papillatum]
MNEAHDALQAMGVIQNLREEAGTVAALTQALDLILRIGNNVVKSPEEAKFRQVKLTNKQFFPTVGVFDSGRKLMELLGFVAEEGTLVIKPPLVPKPGVMRALREAVSRETIKEYDTAVTSSVAPNLLMRDDDFTENDYETLLQLDEQNGMKDLRASPAKLVQSLVVSQASKPITCYVCLDTISPSEDTIRLACGDSFHPYCIRRWAGESRLCPICRQDIRQ